MQRIDQKISFSRKTFILSFKEHDGRNDLRFFTPVSEIAFAEHATVDTVHVSRSSIEELIPSVRDGKIPVCFIPDEIL